MILADLVPKSLKIEQVETAVGEEEFVDYWTAEEKTALNTLCTTEGTNRDTVRLRCWSVKRYTAVLWIN